MSALKEDDLVEEQLTAFQGARELNLVLQNVYTLIWTGRLRAKKNPRTRQWMITRRDFEEFKRARAERKRIADLRREAFKRARAIGRD